MAVLSRIQAQRTRTKVENEKRTSNQRYVLHEVCHLVLGDDRVAHSGLVIEAMEKIALTGIAMLRPTSAFPAAPS
jgi:hypothetical protein